MSIILEFPMQPREWEKRAEAMYTNKKFFKGLGYGILISAFCWAALFLLCWAVTR